MSTNFYWAGTGQQDGPESHIGKRVNNTGFTWAIAPAEFLTKAVELLATGCPTCARPWERDGAPPRIIEDEYGQRWSVDAFLSQIGPPFDFKLIGKYFC